MCRVLDGVFRPTYIESIIIHLSVYGGSATTDQIPKYNSQTLTWQSKLNLYDFITFKSLCTKHFTLNTTSTTYIVLYVYSFKRCIFYEQFIFVCILYVLHIIHVSYKYIIWPKFSHHVPVLQNITFKQLCNLHHKLHRDMSYIYILVNSRYTAHKRKLYCVLAYSRTVRRTISSSGFVQESLQQQQSSNRDNNKYIYYNTHVDATAAHTASLLLSCISKLYYYYCSYLLFNNNINMEMMLFARV